MHMYVCCTEIAAFVARVASDAHSAVVQSRIDRSAAGASKVTVVQEALASFQKLADAGMIAPHEHAARRAQLLDKLADVGEARDDDAEGEGAGEPYDPLFLREELRLGGSVYWLAMHRKNLVKYPFGKPFANPLLGALVASREEVPK